MLNGVRSTFLLTIVLTYLHVPRVFKWIWRVVVPPDLTNGLTESCMSRALTLGTFLLNSFGLGVNCPII